MVKGVITSFRSTCFFISVIMATGPAHGHLYELIAQENLRSLPFEHSNGYYSSEDVIDKEYHELLPLELKKQLNPSPYVQRNAAFKFLSAYEEKNNLKINTNILDYISWQDLELLCGPKSDPTHYLGNKLNRTSTELGRLLFLKKIVNPTSNIDEIKEQQTFVQTLLAHKEIMGDIDTTLAQCCKLENALLSLWNDGLFYGLFLKELNLFSFSKKLSLTLGAHPLILGANEKMMYAENIGMATIALLAAVGAFVFAGLTLSKSNYAAKIEKWNDKTYMAVPLIPKAFCEGLKYLNGDDTSINTNHIVNFSIACITAFGALEWFVYSKNNLLALNAYGNCLQTKLIHIAHYFNNIQRFVHICDQHPELSNFRVVKNLKENFTKVSQSSLHIKQLFDILSTNTFKGKASLFSYRGRVYAAYKLIQLFKTDLADLMIAMAEFDAQVSIAHLYTEFQNQSSSMCYTEFIESPTPAFYMHDFWNPMLDEQTVITNDCVCGTPFNARQNIVITGPNAGGKTTLLRSIVLNGILSQSLGICAARRCIMTPFSKIITYLNITDDIAAGNSHFKAGVVRARQLIDTVKSTHDHEFTLCAVDEAFNGTAFKEGQAAAYSLIKTLGSYKHNICITSTHFPLISHLENDTNLFTNYKVTVYEQPDGMITYPFKLERGTSDQIVTLKILEQEGFGDQFLTQAQEALQMSLGVN